MTDSTGGASAAPPKKRSFFKKAAWQTKPKSESEDIFSHSNEFKDIAAAEARQREEKRRLKEEEKRKITETQERKRRKLSSEEEDIKLPDSGVGSSGRTSRKESAYVKTASVCTAHMRRIANSISDAARRLPRLSEESRLRL
jgi:hypothetical protein